MTKFPQNIHWFAENNEIWLRLDSFCSVTGFNRESIYNRRDKYKIMKMEGHRYLWISWTHYLSKAKIHTPHKNHFQDKKIIVHKSEKIHSTLNARNVMREQSNV